MEKEGGIFRRWLCKREKHIFIKRYKDLGTFDPEREPYSGLFLYGSYGYVPRDSRHDKMCFYCKVYYKNNKKVRDNFYKD